MLSPEQHKSVLKEYLSLSEKLQELADGDDDIKREMYLLYRRLLITHEDEEYNLDALEKNNFYSGDIVFFYTHNTIQSAQYECLENEDSDMCVIRPINSNELFLIKACNIYKHSEDVKHKNARIELYGTLPT